MEFLKKSHKLSLDRLFLVVGLVLAFSGEALAKKAIGYTPPAFYVRALISIVTITPVGLAGALFGYFILRYIDRENCIREWKLYFIIVSVLMLCGVFAGALDAYNDELWNPAMMGAIPISLIIPTAVFVLQKRVRLWARVLIGIALTVPSLLIFEFATYSFQVFGLKIGMPTTW